MKLDRDKAGKAFRNYVAQYNAQDEKVKLKIDHTYRVAALCEQIAQSISLSSDDVDIAWSIDCASLNVPNRRSCSKRPTS